MAGPDPCNGCHNFWSKESPIYFSIEVHQGGIFSLGWILVQTWEAEQGDFLIPVVVAKTVHDARLGGGEVHKCLF